MTKLEVIEFKEERLHHLQLNNVLRFFWNILYGCVLGYNSKEFSEDLEFLILVIILQ
jgi:hypothetical protein